MNTAVLVLLGLTAVLGLLLTVQGERVRPPWAAAVPRRPARARRRRWPGPAGDAPAGLAEAAALGAVLAAVAGGGPVATAVLRAADPAPWG